MKNGTVDATPMPTRFSAVICTLARPDVVRRALTALCACDPPPLEIVVVDGDAARSAEAVTRELRPSARCPIEYLATEPGLTRQRNAGLAAAQGDVVVFLDDDACVAPDVFDRLDRVYAQSSVIGATGRVHEPSSHRFGHQTSRSRRLLFGAKKEGTFTRFGYPRRLTDASTRRLVEVMPGCFMTARLDAARRVGFDEHLSGYALGEDEDFSRRLAMLGPIEYDPTIVIEHDNSGFGGRDRRAFSHRVVLNRAYLFRKNFEQTLLARAQFAGLLGILLVHRLINADGRGALGILDGVRELRRERR